MGLDSQLDVSCLSIVNYTAVAQLSMSQRFGTVNLLSKQSNQLGGGRCQYSDIREDFTP